MKRSARHNYRDRRHVGRCVDVTERAVRKFVSGAGFDARDEPAAFSGFHSSLVAAFKRGRSSVVSRVTVSLEWGPASAASS